MPNIKSAKKRVLVTEKKNALNRSIKSEISNIKDNYLFENEGIHYKNFYGTYVIGPILSRNPEFLELFLKDLIKSKDENFKIKKFNTKLNKQAYNEFIEFKKTKVFNSKNS